MAGDDTPRGSLDALDLDLVAALQTAPRAPFDVLARALDSSSRTVARRYARLVEDGVLRVVCEVDRSLTAEGMPVCVWIRTEAGRAPHVARALADRRDTTHVSVTAGRGDVFCILHAPTRELTTRALTAELPALPGVRSLRTEWILRRLASGVWRLPRLAPERLALLAEHALVPGLGTTHDAGPLETRIAALLHDDARLAFSCVARELGVSESRARRTATAMFASGLLRPRVDVEPPRLGYHVEAIVGIGCAPHHADRVAASLLRHPATRFLAVTAATSLLTHVGVHRDEGELAEFLTEGLGGTADVTAVECTVQLDIVKRYWSLTRPA